MGVFYADLVEDILKDEGLLVEMGQGLGHRHIELLLLLMLLLLLIEKELVLKKLEYG
jgi:hypothetical protein